MTTNPTDLPPSCGPATTLDNETLVQVLIESYARSAAMPNSEIQHNRWVECKAEVLKRLTADQRIHQQSDGELRSADDIVVEFIQNFTKIPLDGNAHRELVRIIEAERTRAHSPVVDDERETLRDFFKLGPRTD